MIFRIEAPDTPNCVAHRLTPFEVALIAACRSNHILHYGLTGRPLWVALRVQTVDLVR
jgi:hypothetical protein